MELEIVIVNKNVHEYENEYYGNEYIFIMKSQEKSRRRRRRRKVLKKEEKERVEIIEKKINHAINKMALVC